MKTILVIEHLLPLQSFLRETLESHGFQTIGAINGKSAIHTQIVHPGRVSLLLTNYQLADINALELLSFMRQSEFLLDIPVVVLSDTLEGAVTEKILARKKVTLLFKPYRQILLISEIRKLVS